MYKTTAVAVVSFAAGVVLTHKRDQKTLTNALEAFKKLVREGVEEGYLLGVEQTTGVKYESAVDAIVMNPRH